MIRVVGIVVRVSEYNLRREGAVLLHQRGDKRVGRTHRIVAGVEELHLGAKQTCRPFRLRAANLFDPFDRHARLLPRALALSAFAVREAENAYAEAARRVQSDGAAGTPDEVGGMGTEHEHGRSLIHGVTGPIIRAD